MKLTRLWIETLRKLVKHMSMTVESASRDDWHTSKPLKREDPAQMCTAAFPLPAWPPARPSGRQSQLQEASDTNPQQFSPDKLQFFPLRLSDCSSCDEVAIVLDGRTTGFLSPAKRRQKPGENPVISFHLWSACLQIHVFIRHRDAGNTGDLKKTEDPLQETYLYCFCDWECGIQPEALC